jgi:uncharacterized Fe-S cluster-containing MiaB family protein
MIFIDNINKKLNFNDLHAAIKQIHYKIFIVITYISYYLFILYDIVLSQS